MKTLTRQDIITAAIDLYGYSESDFDNMTSKEIIKYLDTEYASQGALPGEILNQIKEYLR